jgi:hypothetical protein
MKGRLLTHSVCCKSNVCRRCPSHAALSRVRGDGRKHFSRVVEKLRVLLPPARPVVIQTGQVLSRADGSCGRSGRHFRIRISRELTDAVATDVLIHEWAHALSWDSDIEKASRSRRLSDTEFQHLSHGRKWGLAYSRVYQAYISEIVPILLMEDLNAPFFRHVRIRARE